MKKKLTGKKNSNRKIMLITIGVLAVAVLIVALIGSLSKGGENVPEKEVVSVKEGNITQEIEAVGNVESEVKKTFFSPVNATIQTMTFQTGDSVDAEELLIGFNLENLESENQKAELQLRSGRLDIQDAKEQAGRSAEKIAEAKAEIPALKNKVESKKKELESIGQQISSVQESAQADAKAAYEAALLQAEETYEQEMKVYTEKTRPEYEKNLEELREKVSSEAGTAADEADYRYALENPPALPVKEEINADLSVWGNADTAKLQAKMETVSSELAQIQSELASKQAIADADAPGLTNAAKEKMQIANNLTELESKNVQELLEEGRKGITAEFKGVISDARVTQGAAVSQGMELFTLQSTQEVCVDANISKYDFDKAEEGQKAEITLGKSQYKGTVSRVSRIAVPNEKGTPTIGITVHIDNPDEGIFIGVEAKVKIQTAETKNVLLLPVEVVNIGKDGSFCYVIEDGKVVKKDIETGISSASQVEIKSGLSKGDEVIRSIGSMNEGDAVKAKESGQKKG